ncbi:acyl carrier protein [Flexivirga alba]|jgi:Acyl carrier protein|uniref:Acyl carrier protein n=1 Tax=Flexivirga alba TaxID=702742 RepID=A0ABW2AFX0_9MICO
MAETTFEQVKDVVVETLGIQSRSTALTADTQLLDSMPELDSMAVVDLLVRLENHFDIRIDDSAVSGEVFGTLGTLADFVESARAHPDA